MVQRRTCFAVGIVIGLLMLSFPTAAIAHCCPPCDACEYCDEGDCIQRSCPPCHKCVGGDCVCITGEDRCCSDADCGGSGCCKCELCGCTPYDTRCNSANCEECVDCSCVVCNGDPDQVCCNGQCRPKCEDGEPTGQCDTSYNEECIGCTVFPYTCPDFTMREYYGNEVRYCTGGCPGDCVQQNAVECYVEYECKYGTQLGMRICATEGEGVACKPWGDLWFCTPCVKNPEEWVIEYAYPRECQ